MAPVFSFITVHVIKEQVSFFWMGCLEETLHLRSQFFRLAAQACKQYQNHFFRDLLLKKLLQENVEKVTDKSTIFELNVYLH